MKFTQISASAFRDFAEQSPYFSFMQTPEIAKLRAKSGWKSYYLAVKDQKGQILAATLALAKPTFLGRYQTFYTPGGPLLDLENRELTDFFFEHLAKFARQKNAYVLHIDPYYELIERDRDGQLVAGGFEHAKALLNLDRLGFRPLENTSMPNFLFALDFSSDLKSLKTEQKPNKTKNNTKANTNTKSKSRSKSESHPNPTSTSFKLPTPETVFAQFKQNTRNLTRRCERQGIIVRELKREDLPLLKQITESTSERRHFSDQPLSYYQSMYDLFAPKNQVKFLLAELPDPENGKKSIPLSVAMFMLVGSEVVYLYSGSDEAYMKKYNAQYLIQWHMIKYALENGFSRYNFYGIRGLPNPKSKDYGIYRFKKGFGGHVIELIGSFELPLNRPIYRLHTLLSNLKHRLSRK